MHETQTTCQRRGFKRHDLAAILPELIQRLQSGEFTSLETVAASYAVDKATACRWKSRAIASGFIDEKSWRAALLRGRLRELAA